MNHYEQWERIIKEAQQDCVIDLYSRNMIVESSLSNIATRYRDSGFIIVGAERGDYSAEENKQRTRALQNILKQLHTDKKIGYVPLRGGFLETNAETQEVTPVEEYSFLIPKPADMQWEEFLHMGKTLMNKFEQEAILVGEPNKKDTYYLFANGAKQPKNIFHIGNADPNSDNDEDKGYSTLVKGKHAGRQWRYKSEKLDTIRGIPMPNTVMGRKSVSSNGEMLSGFGKPVVDKYRKK